MAEPSVTLEVLLEGITDDNIHPEFDWGEVPRRSRAHEESLFPHAPNPVIEFYKKDVDRTLIEVNLRLTPEQRILKLMELQRFAEELRRAGEEARRKAKAAHNNAQENASPA